MSDENLLRLIDAIVDGTISEEDHRALQRRLASDASARALFRERIDLEAGLRTWAQEQSAGAGDRATRAQGNPARCGPRTAPRSWRWGIAAATLAAAALVLIASQIVPSKPSPDRIVSKASDDKAGSQPADRRDLGRLVEGIDCRWRIPPALQAGRFSAGAIALASGAAELRFDSGTNLILQGPCELSVESTDSARLRAGTLVVEVTEVSVGFTLETPEARIIDEGTEYAVSLDEDATEVHVFDGSVIWLPTDAVVGLEDRIASGEARRFLRSEPGRPRRIPFGLRQFVRRIEADLRESTGGALLAYDGFENLAGHLRRGRSGFGWADGWIPAAGERGRIASVVDAPGDVVFGLDRSGRRLLALESGDDIRRCFEEPVAAGGGDAWFVSLLIGREPARSDSGQALQITLEPDAEGLGAGRRDGVTFGVTSRGFPFISVAGEIDETATGLLDRETYLVVLKLGVRADQQTAALRVYRPGERADAEEPDAWTAQATSMSITLPIRSIRLSAGPEARWRLDELKVGSAWSSVVPPDVEQD
ncbi:FecR domain-containing protein [Tautonia rosea]|uniref:FecR domain-containing protein n=1 Tax=Tautonia rosea TaxID=2728037 RepID=UPI0014763CD4|nr:FecR domain-containing protein [Tautonia rosea]